MTRIEADLDLSTTAEMLDLPEQAVLRWAEKGALPADTSQGELRFAKNDVLDWARHMGMRLPNAANGNRPRTTEPNVLAASLRRGTLAVDIAGATPREALQNLVAQLQDLTSLGLKGVDGAALLDLLVTREELASTAVGDGFAVPHCRNPLGQSLEQSVAILARLRQPIDWNALDGQPVHTLLLVLSPNLELQLELLRRVALAIRDDGVRSLVANGAGLDAICDAIEAVPE